jgi:hypothetical protein
MRVQRSPSLPEPALHSLGSSQQQQPQQHGRGCLDWPLPLQGAAVAFLLKVLLGVMP